MKHFNITFEPDGRRVAVHAGATLLEAAGQADIILNTICGGKGTCNKCMVNLAPDGRQVLACQYHIDSDLTVTIPPSSRFFEHKILTEGVPSKAGIKPDVYKQYLKLAAADNIFGVAVDIGTTTVVAKLLDMTTGKPLATQADLNPQIRFGDDVISRISYAQTDENLAELHYTITDFVNELIEKLCRQVPIDTNEIFEICVVGNTTMNHIFLKLPVAQLGQAPYRAFSLDAKDLPPEKLRLQMNPAGNIHTVENIAGFVGSDTVAVALAADINSAEDLTLVVDIGTNGEVVLGNKDKLCAASCAAGPAFEGGRISCGSRAAEGAIEAVFVDGNDIDYDCIGNRPPHSICGSGLLDAVAVLLDLGIIDLTGRFIPPLGGAGFTTPGSLPPAIASRICVEQGQPAFCLYRAANVSERSLFLTQKDIREVQLAKAAIRTGIKMLQNKMGVEDNAIKQVLLAGAFGNYIRRESALRIGLLPDLPPERIHFIGNAAASGAEMLLISQKCRTQAGKLARKIEYVEIAHQPNFQDVFTESMSF